MNDDRIFTKDEKEAVKFHLTRHCAGHKNAIKREHICAALGISDRLFRAIVAHLRAVEFIPIISLRTGGYFVAVDENDFPFVDEFLAIEKSREFKIRKSRTGVKNGIKIICSYLDKQRKP